jgi:general secretion pathway protein I
VIRSRRGFTLVEVLVALIIVATCMSALLGAMTSAADAAYHMRDHMFAEWVALNRIAEVRMQPRMPKTGKTDGEAEMAGRKWEWQQDVKPLQLENMFRIDVSVRPKEGVRGAGTKAANWYATVTGMVGDAVERGPQDPAFLDMSAASDRQGPPGGQGSTEQPGQENQENQAP